MDSQNVDMDGGPMRLMESQGILERKRGGGGCQITFVEKPIGFIVGQIFADVAMQLIVEKVYRLFVSALLLHFFLHILSTKLSLVSAVITEKSDSTVLCNLLIGV